MATTGSPPSFQAYILRNQPPPSALQRSAPCRVAVDDTPWLKAMQSYWTGWGDANELGVCSAAYIGLASLRAKMQLRPTLWALAGEKKRHCHRRELPQPSTTILSSRALLDRPQPPIIVFRWRKWSSEHGTEHFHHDVVCGTFRYEDSESPLSDRRRERSRSKHEGDSFPAHDVSEARKTLKRLYGTLHW